VNGLLRVRWWPGALLSGADLEAYAASAARLQALHVRGAHATWGIALGFEVQPGGAGIFKVGAGLAYDRCGRTLVSADTAALHAPAADGDYVLLAGPRGPHWTRPGCARDDEVALDGLTVSNGKPGTLDPTVRSGARGSAPARVRGGRAEVKIAGKLETVTKVDTAAGGFLRIPFYFATLVPPTAQALPHWTDVYGPWLELRAPTTTSFQLVTRFARPHTSLPGGGRIAVEWLGVESARSGERKPD
jgi:hypothetical protein